MLTEDFPLVQGAIVGGKELHAAAEKRLSRPRGLADESAFNLVPDALLVCSVDTLNTHA